MFKGILPKDNHHYTEKRILLSFKICCIGLFCELVGGLITMAYPLLKMLWISNIYLADAVMVFVVVPMVHLLNDGKAKEIFVEGNYYKALRHMIGYNVEKE